ncbi:hypothetical protein CRG98_042722 [Punica granatum]|uniref:Uncharacterized protein n=1 Tax=Punica granatum TaxID=22663 RepID=A0A2I0HZE3_PUNGR|nr:hypothetical protein CRG98_042722 [Punica granatum]
MRLLKASQASSDLTWEVGHRHLCGERGVGSDCERSPVDNLSPRGKGPGPSIGDADPTIEVACTHRGCRRPWRWGQGRRLAAPAHELIGISNYSGSRATNRRPRPHPRENYADRKTLDTCHPPNEYEWESI